MLPSGDVDYARLRPDPGLRAWVQALTTAAEPPPGPARQAFWINAYNGLMVALVAEAWPLQSPRELDGGRVWDTRRFTVAGQTLTLNQIEHERLRPAGDPRVHAALSCASRGCAPLRPTPYTAEGLDAQLDAAARAWVASTAVQIDREGHRVLISEVFRWYAADFAGVPGPPVPGAAAADQGALRFLARHARPEDAALLRAGGYAVAVQPYDWTVNAPR